MRIFLLFGAAFAAREDDEPFLADSIFFRSPDRHPLPVSTALWKTVGESIPAGFASEIPTIKGNMHIGRRVGSATLTRVYLVEGREDLVAKYSMYCGDEIYEPIDCLENEYWVYQRIENAGLGDITNSVMYLSDPIDTKEYPGLDKHRGKVPFKLCSEMYAEALLKFPTIRFSIGTRLGMPLSSLIDAMADLLRPRTGVAIARGIPFKRAISIGIQVFGSIEKLHSIDVVHGDVHAGNLAFKHIADRIEEHVTRPELDELALFDFGRSVVMDAEKLSLQSPTNPASYTRFECHGISSPWESVFLPLSFRDDLYRGLVLVANMVYGFAHSSLLEQQCGSAAGDAYQLAFKMNGNLFDFSMTSKAGTEYQFRLANVVPVGREAIERKFRQMLVIARGAMANEKPSAAAIKQLLTEVLAIASPAARPTKL